ncbi:50S ribosomal protein L32 [Candidatus Woesebacteria bacterium]|nr:50S ribosomal protein L32 [Candidatus Woesebacteria bacterium]
MAPVPKKKHTRARSNQRKNAREKRLLVPNLVKCPSCKKLKFPHRVCPHCGFYREAGHSR